MKVLLIATVQSHICQFHKPLVEMLHERNCEVHVAARNNLSEKNGLKLGFVEQVFDVPFERSPFSPKNLKAYFRLRRIIRDGNYDVIYCNTPVGGVLGRLAARKTRTQGTKVIYTAHGFHFYKGSPKKNWAIWYPIEKFMSRFCDVLITINEEDFSFAKEHFSGDVEHIHGVGVREDRYHPVSYEDQLEMRRREGLKEDAFVVICTGELNENKNQKTLISAAAILREKIPNLKVLLAGNGPNEQELQDQISAEHLGNIVRLLGYRTDLEHVVPAVDVVVSCSKREGLPLNIVEAMLCKKPVVASINRGNSELVEDGKSGFLLEPEDVNGFADCLIRINADKQMAEQFGEAGYRKAQGYTVKAVKKELATILFGE